MVDTLSSRKAIEVMYINILLYSSNKLQVIDRIDRYRSLFWVFFILGGLIGSYESKTP